jgi:hypothetical protein
MAEVWSFAEAIIKRVGSASGDSTESQIDNFATNVRVYLKRKLAERRDHSGNVLERISQGVEVDLSMDKLYVNDPFLFDGNAIKLYFGNSVGSETRQMGGCYWESKDWGAAGDGLWSEGITIKGNSWGTV